MSEYQYYAFQAIDRPLDKADRDALRAISTRASITATTFVNSYDYGSFKGDPCLFMTRWFDLHLYLANWGTRRLMMRLPKRLVNPVWLAGLVTESDGVELIRAGDDLVLDVVRDDEQIDDDDDGSGWLAAMAPLRADMMSGDHRLAYLLWLMAEDADAIADDVLEPLMGLGPMSGPLTAFVEFFGLDVDLVTAAAERPAIEALPAGSERAIIEALSDAEKTILLMRFLGGDPHVAAELRGRVKTDVAAKQSRFAMAPRTVRDLQARRKEIAAARKRADADRAAAAQAREKAAAEAARRGRIADVARDEEGAWRRAETAIERMIAAGYDDAAALVADLHALAEDRGTGAAFKSRVAALIQRHERKRSLVKRLEAYV